MSAWVQNAKPRRARADSHPQAQHALYQRVRCPTEGDLNSGRPLAHARQHTDADIKEIAHLHREVSPDAERYLVALPPMVSARGRQALNVGLAKNV